LSRRTPIPAVRMTAGSARVDPKSTFTAAGAGSVTAPILDGDGPVAKGAARDQVRKEMPMLSLVLSSDSHVNVEPCQSGSIWARRSGNALPRVPH
jgi:hypothetical protein